MNWILVVYLIGFIPHYLLFRRWYTGFNYEWTVGARWVAIGTSVFSWVGCFASVLLILTEGGYGDKKANW